MVTAAGLSCYQSGGFCIICDPRCFSNKSECVLMLLTVPSRKRSIHVATIDVERGYAA